MSLSSDILLYEEHMKWFKKILADPNEVFLFFEDSLVKLKLGIVRFELNMDKGTGLVSINLSPESRGKSYAKPCLNAAIKELRMNFHSCHTLFAEIKNDNIPSLRSFEGIGFKLDKNGNDFLTYKLKL
jgi:RimJ/RimL family protein N-acetyltransferase